MKWATRGLRLWLWEEWTGPPAAARGLANLQVPRQPAGLCDRGHMLQLWVVGCPHKGGRQRQKRRAPLRRPVNALPRRGRGDWLWLWLLRVWSQPPSPSFGTGGLWRRGPISMGSCGGGGIGPASTARPLPLLPAVDRHMGGVPGDCQEGLTSPNHLSKCRGDRDAHCPSASVGEPWGAGSQGRYVHSRAQEGLEQLTDSRTCRLAVSKT